MCAFTIGAALAGLLRSLKHDFASWEKNASLADMEKLRQALKTKSAGYEKVHTSGLEISYCTLKNQVADT